MIQTLIKDDCDDFNFWWEGEKMSSVVSHSGNLEDFKPVQISSWIMKRLGKIAKVQKFF